MKVQRSTLTGQREKIAQREGVDMSIDLKKNAAALKGAFQEVLSNSSDVNW